MKIKFIFLLEMPAKVTITQRVIINRELKRMAYELPKRNVFLLELENEKMAQKIKKFIIKNSSSDSKVNYYRLYE